MILLIPVNSDKLCVMCMKDRPLGAAGFRQEKNLLFVSSQSQSCSDNLEIRSLSLNQNSFNVGSKVSYAAVRQPDDIPLWYIMIVNTWSKLSNNGKEDFQDQSQSIRANPIYTEFVSTAVMLDSAEAFMLTI